MKTLSKSLHKHQKNHIPKQDHVDTITEKEELKIEHLFEKKNVLYYNLKDISVNSLLSFCKKDTISNITGLELFGKVRTDYHNLLSEKYHVNLLDVFFKMLNDLKEEEYIIENDNMRWDINVDKLLETEKKAWEINTSI